jgi:hypothetical protein
MSSERIERVIALAERLIAALEADIAALENGQPQAMKSLDPEVQKISALYAREAAGLNAAMAQAAPETVRNRLMATTARFREVLAHQARIVTRVRNASEGIVQAVAQEVERRRTIVRPYGQSYKARPGGAMLYNTVT